MSPTGATSNRSTTIRDRAGCLMQPPATSVSSLEAP